jgi:hypothetical protein
VRLAVVLTMRVTQVAAILCSLSFALLTAACVQVSDPVSETDGPLDQEAAVSIERAPGGSFATEITLKEAASDPKRLGICLALAPAPISAKVAFCDTLPELQMYARCMAHRWNRVQWTGWCYFEFLD